MKIQLIIILALVSCFNQKKYHNKSKDYLTDLDLYKVYKIDSIKNFYLIYAKRKDIPYKIVSEKTHVDNCEPIRVNEKYPFILHSRLSSRKIGNTKIMPGNVDCFYYGDSTFICLEDAIYDLHSADNIKGLCFLKDYKQTGIK